MASNSMALHCIILLAVLPWTGVPVRMNLNAAQLHLEKQRDPELNASNGTAKPNRTQSVEPEAYEMVYANVYDLDDSNSIAAVNTVLFAGGLYHVGIEAFGMEFQYGGAPSEETGVSGHTNPRTHPAHKFYKSVPIGLTRLNKEEFLDVVRRLAGEDQWKANNYDVLHNNCIVFADDLLKALPERYTLKGWMKRLMHVGQAVLPTLGKALGALSRGSQALSNASKKVHQACSDKFNGACGEFRYELFYRVSCPVGECCKKFQQMPTPMCVPDCPGTQDELYSNNANGACTASNHSDMIGL